MIYLNNKIVAYLNINAIQFTDTDFIVTQTGNDPEQISYWNKKKLGVQPTEQQLDEAYSIWNGQQIAVQNKATTTQLLQETDWVELPSVSDTAITPHLTNINQFISYRAALRAIAVNPPTTPAVFPNKPQEQWSDA